MAAILTYLKGKDEIDLTRFIKMIDAIQKFPKGGNDDIAQTAEEDDHRGENLQMSLNIRRVKRNEVNISSTE